MNAFITGSHAYGEPTAKSDVDFVVRVSESTARKLLELRDDYEGRGSKVVRFGKLNIVLCTTDEDFAVWRLGTTHMTQIGNVEKSNAKKVLDGLRNLVGLKDFGDSNDTNPLKDAEPDEKQQPKKTKRPKPKAKKKSSGLLMGDEPEDHTAFPFY